MIQLRRPIIWFLLIFIGFSGLISDSAEESMAKAVQAATGRWSAPDLDELDDDAEIPVQTVSGTDSTLQIQSDPNAATAPPQRSVRSLQIRPVYASVLPQILPSVTPQLISLRL